MKVLLFLLIFSISIFAEIPKNVKDIVVKLKASQYDASALSMALKTSIDGKIRTGISEFDELSEKYKFKKIKYGFKKDHMNLKKSKIFKKLNLQNVLKVSLEDSVDVDEIIKEMESAGIFEYVAIPEKVNITSVSPDDDYYLYQWQMNYLNSLYPSTDAISSADLDMESAWDITTGSSSTVVAILDTGNRIDHPDLNGRIWINSGEVPLNGKDDDGNGYVDDYYGWNFAQNSGDITDNGGHGTHVAGIIGANGDNGSLVAGMDWNTKLMAVKVLGDDGNGTTTMWHDGIIYAVDNGADVINMSLGGVVTYQGTIDYVQEAVDYAYEHGVVVIASSGNDNSGVDNFYPAACDSLLCVGSTDDNGNRSSFSNYGNHMDVVAPGEIIWSLDYNDYSRIAGMSGTSQAAPHVAGMVSLMLAVDPSLTASEIFEVVRTTAIDGNGLSGEDVDGFDKYYGYGLINPVAALNMVLNGNSAPAILSQVTEITLDEDSEITISLGDLNVLDADGDNLVLIVKSGDNYSFSGNTVYPNKDFSGDLTINVVVSDGKDESNLFNLFATVNEINDAPKVIDQDAVIEVDMGGVFEVTLDDINYIDVDGEIVYLEVLSGENYQYIGNEIYPDDGFEGELSVNIRLSDGELNSENFVLLINVGDVSFTTSARSENPKEIGNEKLVVAPMPFVNSAKALYEASQDGDLDIYIYTNNEVLMHKSSMYVFKGENEFALNGVNKLKRGLYYLVFKLNGKVDVVKVIVKSK